MSIDGYFHPQEPDTQAMNTMVMISLVAAVADPGCFEGGFQIQEFLKGVSHPGFFKVCSILDYCRKHFHTFNLMLLILLFYLMCKGGSMEPKEPPWIRHCAANDLLTSFS